MSQPITFKLSPRITSAWQPEIILWQGSKVTRSGVWPLRVHSRWVSVIWRDKTSLSTVTTTPGSSHYDYWATRDSRPPLTFPPILAAMATRARPRAVVCQRGRLPRNRFGGNIYLPAIYIRKEASPGESHVTSPTSWPQVGDNTQTVFRVDCREDWLPGGGSYTGSVGELWPLLRHQRTIYILVCPW